ncbi:MAG TPA: DUF2293 domain-containing protein [Phycisphaerae bacterium]|nr:DUF2293 domain-containing protein [Phycisphaerae bacterium]HRR84232.1 DUF2293 domain-containing protein [Phycisphaerae bacterium]
MCMSEKRPLTKAGGQERIRNPAPTADPTTRTLVVYQTRPEEVEKGDVWNPEYGLLWVPKDWEYLAPGDAFVTRFVKRGPHWALRGRFNRKKGYRRKLGIYAPSATIREAQAAAERTEAARKEQRAKAAVVREKAEDRYRREFEQACIEFLNFSKRYAKLAARIARETTDRACQKYSGRVGRTQKLDLATKAALAVRACIRHKYTGYEDKVPPFPDPLLEDEYRTARQMAHEDVDAFLERHRDKGG